MGLKKTIPEASQMDTIKRMGRPTKYKKRFIKEAEKYLQECKSARKVPFIEEFAGRIGVSEDSVKRWTEANEDFCGAIERIKDHQRLALKTLGLKSSAVIIFLLKANHGMIETEKHQLEGKDGGPIEFKDVMFFSPSAIFKKRKENETRQKNNNDWTSYSGMGSVTDS